MSRHSPSFNIQLITLPALCLALACQPTQTKPGNPKPTFTLVQPSLVSAPPLTTLVNVPNGSVVIEVVVGPTGRVVETRLVSGSELTYKQSDVWLRGLIFIPGNFNGENVHCRVKVTIEYSKPTATYKIEVPNENGRWN